MIRIYALFLRICALLFGADASTPEEPEELREKKKALSLFIALNEFTKRDAVLASVLCGPYPEVKREGEGRRPHVYSDSLHTHSRTKPVSIPLSRLQLGILQSVARTGKSPIPSLSPNHHGHSHNGDEALGGVPKWLRERSAKPPFTGSNPVAAFFSLLVLPASAYLCVFSLPWTKTHPAF